VKVERARDLLPKLRELEPLGFGKCRPFKIFRLGTSGEHRVAYKELI